MATEMEGLLIINPLYIPAVIENIAKFLNNMENYKIFRVVNRQYRDIADDYHKFTFYVKLGDMTDEEKILKLYGDRSEKTLNFIRDAVFIHGFTYSYDLASYDN